MTEVGRTQPPNGLGPSTAQQPFHVHDLPQIYTRPSYEKLMNTLNTLKLKPTSFSNPSPTEALPQIDPQGMPRYLTSFVSSSLSWLEDDAQREAVWEAASARLSERSGRNAMPSMTRSFYINEQLTIELFEPSLTEDNLGLKTWTSSLLLARRLPSLRHHLPTNCEHVLEFGSGTGLVGIAAAVLWDVNATLTDLPEIVANLQQNVASNMRLVESSGRNLIAEPLDWADTTNSPQAEVEKASVIIAADPIYSSDHPKLLVDAVSRWLRQDESARFIVELPLRQGYEKERADLNDRLRNVRMAIVEEGTEIGYDDWQGADGRPSEVECWWSVWKRITTEKEHDQSIKGEVGMG